MRNQCVLLKDFGSLIKVDPKLFTLKSIAENHPDDIIDVVHQNPNLYGFMQTSKMFAIYIREPGLMDF